MILLTVLVIYGCLWEVLGFDCWLRLSAVSSLHFASPKDLRSTVLFQHVADPKTDQNPTRLKIRELAPHGKNLLDPSGYVTMKLSKFIFLAAESFSQNPSKVCNANSQTGESKPAKQLGT